MNFEDDRIGPGIPEAMSECNGAIDYVGLKRHLMLESIELMRLENTKLSVKLTAALDGLKRIAEVIEECTGKTKLPLVTQIASIAAATIARVEEWK